MGRFKAALIARQNGDRDLDFAAQLGIGRAHWNYMRRGHRPISKTVIRQAVRLWPDLLTDYLADVRADLLAE